MSGKLYTEEQLNKEKNFCYSDKKYTRMLEYNNSLLKERLKAAIGFLELQEKHSLPDAIVFFWREIVLEEK